MELKLSSSGGMTSPVGLPKLPGAGHRNNQPSIGSRSMVNLETEMEKMRLDVMALKQNEQIKQQELEQFFQNSSMQYFEKI